MSLKYMLKYAMKIGPDEDAFIGTFRDLPKLFCPGDTPDEVMQYAVEGVETMISIFIDDRQRVPLPTPAQEGERYVYVPCTTAAKSYLNNALIDTRTSDTALAEAMGIPKQSIRRLLDVKHKSKMEQLERALLALGIKLAVTAEAA